MLQLFCNNLSKSHMSDGLELLKLNARCIASSVGILAGIHARKLEA